MLFSLDSMCCNRFRFFSLFLCSFPWLSTQLCSVVVVPFSAVLSNVHFTFPVLSLSPSFPFSRSLSASASPSSPGCFNAYQRTKWILFNSFTVSVGIQLALHWSLSTQFTSHDIDSLWHIHWMPIAIVTHTHTHTAPCLHHALYHYQFWTAHKDVEIFAHLHKRKSADKISMYWIDCIK